MTLRVAKKKMRWPYDFHPYHIIRSLTWVPAVKKLAAAKVTAYCGPQTVLEKGDFMGPYKKSHKSELCKNCIAAWKKEREVERIRQQREEKEAAPGN